MTDIQEIDQTTNEPSNGDQRKKNKFAVKEEITEENCKFSEGQILKFVRVRFPGHAKSYPFLIGKRNLVYGQKVMAMSDRGMAVGYINSFEYEIPFKKNLLPLRSINKSASAEDIDKEKENYKKQKEIETTCQNLIDKHNLDMNLTHVEFTQFGKKVVFYFVASARVDFRGLVKDLVSELRLRIELRQISVRDRAASQGALGACGRELCCSSFLSKYGNVGIKMAKNQNLTLNYSKLNGVCGQLKCCLQYEDEVYAHKRKRLPSEGDLILCHNGDSGKVRKLFILNEQFEILTDKGKIKRYTFDQFSKIHKNADYRFPRTFDNISDETGNIIGLTERETKITKQFDRDMEKINKRAKKFAATKIDELSEFLPERERDEDPDLNIEVEELKSIEELPELFTHDSTSTHTSRLESRGPESRDAESRGPEKSESRSPEKREARGPRDNNRSSQNRKRSNNPRRRNTNKQNRNEAKKVDTKAKD